MNRRLQTLTTLSVAISAVLASAWLIAEEEDADDATAEVQVVEPGQAKKFSVGEGTLIRIKAGGIAGAVETAKVTGPLKVARKDRVRRLTAEGRPLIGPSGVEFEIEATAEGEGTIEITVINPTDRDNPKVTKYSVTVE